MFSTSVSILHVPNDVMYLIATYLTYREVIHLSKTNRQLRKTVAGLDQTNYWSNQLQLVFPEQETSKNFSTKNEFVTLFKSKYNNFKKHHLRLLFIFKENNLTEIENISFTIHDLIFIRDHQRRCLIELASEEMLKYCYNYCLKQKYSKISKIHLAAMLNQKDELRNLMLLTPSDVDQLQHTHIIKFQSVTPLFFAAACGHIEAIDLLFLSGAQFYIDQATLTPLHAACIYGQKAVVELLINSYSVNVLLHHRRQISADFSDYEYLTPLHYACRNNYPEIVLFLLEKGAQDNHLPLFRDRIQCFYPTILERACTDNQLPIVKLLINHLNYDLERLIDASTYSTDPFIKFLLLKLALIKFIAKEETQLANEVQAIKAPAWKRLLNFNDANPLDLCITAQILLYTLNDQLQIDVIKALEEHYQFSGVVRNIYKKLCKLDLNFIQEKLKNEPIDCLEKWTADEARTKVLQAMLR